MHDPWGIHVSQGHSIARTPSEVQLRPNKAVNADAQVRPPTSCAPILVRRLPLRYATRRGLLGFRRAAETSTLRP